MQVEFYVFFYMCVKLFPHNAD